MSALLVCAGVCVCSLWALARSQPCRRQVYVERASARLASRHSHSHDRPAPTCFFLVCTHTPRVSPDHTYTSSAVSSSDSPIVCVCACVERARSLAPVRQRVCSCERARRDVLFRLTAQRSAQQHSKSVLRVRPLVPFYTRPSWCRDRAAAVLLTVCLCARVSACVYACVCVRA